MANAPIDPLTNTVNVRGLMWSAQGIRDMMAETGGIVVSDERINQQLDFAVYSHIAQGKAEPTELFIEAIPAKMFVPFRMKVHRGPQDKVGTLTNKYLYFAVPRLF